MSILAGNGFRAFVSFFSGICATASFFHSGFILSEKVMVILIVVFSNIIIFFSCLKEVYNSRSAITSYHYSTILQALISFVGASVGVVTLAFGFSQNKDVMIMGCSFVIFCLAVVTNCLKKRVMRGETHRMISGDDLHSMEMQLMNRSNFQDDPPTYVELFGEQPPSYAEVFEQPSLHGTMYAETEL